MNLAKSCGEPILASNPSLPMLAFISGERRLSLIAALSLSTISAGVPAGASTPAQNSSVSSRQPGFAHGRHVRQIGAAGSGW